MIDAIRQELTTGAPATALALLRRHWLRLILESHTAELEQLCVEFPEPIDPNLLLIRACCRDLAGDTHGAAFLRGQGSRPETSEFVACFTNLLLAPDNTTKSAIADSAREALSACGPDDDYPSALFLLGWAEVRLRRNLGEAIALLRSASEEARLHSRPETHRLAQANLAFALAQAGFFSEATLILDGLPLRESASDWDLFEGGLVDSTRGSIAYWRGDFETAITLLGSLVSPGSPGTNFEAYARLYLTLSLVAVNRQHRFREAHELLQGVSVADKHGVPWGILRGVASGWLVYAEGQPALAKKIASPALTRTGAPVAHALLAALFERLGERELAGQALKLVAATAAPSYAQVSSLVTSACLSAMAGRGPLAHEHLDRALGMAALEGVLTPFLSTHAPLGDLLSAHAHRGSQHDDFLQLIFAQRDSHSRLASGMLTKREREILTQLRTTRTGEEIAAHLAIAYPTVKTHIRAIYRKLGVATRREAIRVADSR
ncbi:LuxR C-terminal-related transcriptional regulator [Leucobacter komagatae]|uniref:LuxR C-terminal-related transcriptional regulator n=1 Tax=Leucobacter komagatae TaxID=55969 RepID=UPI0005AC0A6B|nr:LuxR C-terminal-related transcriptional regulator [Leucobacter komagatae]